MCISKFIVIIIIIISQELRQEITSMWWMKKVDVVPVVVGVLGVAKPRLGSGCASWRSRLEWSNFRSLPCWGLLEFCGDI